MSLPRRPRIRSCSIRIASSDLGDPGRSHVGRAVRPNRKLPRRLVLPMSKRMMARREPRPDHDNCEDDGMDTSTIDQPHQQLQTEFQDVAIGMFGGGGMHGDFLNSGFGRAMGKGAGIGLGKDLINSIF
jgi:hypothetical protein